MWFHVPEQGRSVDVYWFEVVRACDLLLQHTMHMLIQTLELLHDSKRPCYAQRVLQLSQERCTDALSAIKKAIGVCHYTLSVANVQCIFLREACPDTLSKIRQRYHTLRVLGVWLHARQQLLVTRDYTAAWNEFATCEAIAAAHETTAATKIIVRSSRLLRLYALVHRALRDKQYGVAQARIRDAKQELSDWEQADSKPVFDLLIACIGAPDALSLVAVPTKSSPLLELHVQIKMNALEIGLSPLPKCPVLRCRGGPTKPI
jgi:hypothetical protein